MALLVSGCKTTILDCRSESITPSYFASVKVSSIDNLLHPVYGSQVVMEWNIPRQYLNKDKKIELVVLLKDLTIINKTFVIHKLKDVRTFFISNDQRLLEKTILSYKAEITSEGLSVAKWKHFLWVDEIIKKQG